MTHLQALTRAILQRPFDHPWTLQGFGMLRLYLADDKSLRLHVWDDTFAVPGVSETHTHPWNFTSTVVAGFVKQHRFIYATDAEIEAGLYEAYMEQRILCGEGGGLCDMPMPAKLTRGPEERYFAGDTYTQEAEEIHVSTPARGTVTIVEREFLSDADHASVFWPASDEWVSAEPRPATAGEIRTITEGALARWF